MDCPTVRRELGLYLDGRLAEARRAALEGHLASCAACQRELAYWRGVTEGLAGPAEVYPPRELWPGIVAGLERRGRPVRAGRLRLGRFEAVVAVAAAVAVVVGLTLVRGPGKGGGSGVARAAVVDFGLLLRDLGRDVDEGAERFLGSYGARVVSRQEARRAVRGLAFALPADLPGGFSFRQAYRLELGGQAGVAARYYRDGELLLLVFHPSAVEHRFGRRRAQPCSIDGRRGLAVEGGSFNLVHFVSGRTCYCVLSRLSREAVAEVLRRVVAD
ncbi:MAG: anti-sigma factor family protein [Phycisphaerae bacterium]